MKVIVGLGNPGKKYEGTRHNAGFFVVDALAALYSLTWSMVKPVNSHVAKSGELFLVKPQTYMNDSGVAVSDVLSYYKVSVADLTVIHDDLDITLGEYKIQKGVGPKVHNGLLSIEEYIGVDFTRVRVGIENRDSENRIPGETYVLTPFSTHERTIMEATVGDVIKELTA